MDFLEILDIAAYDLDEARKIIEQLKSEETIKAVLRDAGLEKIQSKPMREERGRLRRPCCSCCPESELERSLLVIVQSRS